MQIIMDTINTIRFKCIQKVFEYKPKFLSDFCFRCWFSLLINSPPPSIDPLECEFCKEDREWWRVERSPHQRKEDMQHHNNRGWEN